MIQRDQPTIFDDKLLAAVSSADDGNLSLARGPATSVLPARQKWLARLGLTLNQLVVMDVTDAARWDHIHEVAQADKGAGGEAGSGAIVADALVTNQPGLVLFLLIADCQPAIIYDPLHAAVAVVHLGRQSVEAELAPKVIQFMSQQYRSRPADLRIYIGPAIKAASYVFPAVAQADHPGWQPYLDKTAGGIHIDISHYVRDQLLRAGILAAHIETSPVDTAASADYFSHYRAARSHGREPEARFAAIAMLR